jgi:bifunctional oligoribonuclease and PAP phosphatase NrnA
MKYKEITELIEAANKIVVIQAENPDGDSLSSSLALEEILGGLGKEPMMYCPVDMPKHLRHLAGWDRVSSDLPKDFDLSIIVDTSAMTLLEKAFAGSNMSKIKSKPLAVIDHHGTESDIDFATVLINETTSVATGQVIYKICQDADWKISVLAGEFLASSIMYDSLGLVSEGTSPESIRIVADLVETGVSLAKLDSLRRESNVRALEITHYKGKLLQRIELLCDNRLAYIHIPWEEIQQYSDQYNPSMLAIDDMRFTEGVMIAVALKTYPDGKITGKLRANYNVPVSAKIAERFGGGGHVYAAGFKTRDLTLEDVRTKLQQYTNEALDELI